MSLLDWSDIADENATADEALPVPATMAARDYIPLIWGMMAALRRYADDVGGALVTTGTGDLYLVQSRSEATELRAGVSLLIRFDRANAGPVTLSVNELPPFPLVGAQGAALTSGQIAAGQTHLVIYEAGAARWRAITLISNLGDVADALAAKADKEVLLRLLGPGSATAPDDTALIQAYADSLTARGEKYGYLPPGTYDAPGLIGLGDTHFIGEGRITGAYNKYGSPPFSYAPGFNDIDPALHLPRFSTTQAPVVVMIGDSTSTKFADALSENDTLSRMVENALREQNPHKTITFYNRGIGSTSAPFFSLSPNTGLPSSAQFPWMTDPAKIWSDYVKDLSPDLVLVNWGTNDTWNHNPGAFRLVDAVMSGWPKPPDIIYVTNTTATTAYPDVTSFPSDIEQRGRDGPAGSIRTWAKTQKRGVLDVNRAESMMVDGFDPCTFYSERVVKGSPITSPATVALASASLPRPVGATRIAYEGASGTECRHYAFQATFSSVPTNFWGDVPLGTRTIWATGQVVVIGDVRQWLGRLYTATTGGTTGATAPTHTTGIVSDGAVSWELTTFVAPLFVRLGSTVSPSDAYPDGVSFNDLLLWRDSTTGNVFWRIRDRRYPSVFGYADELGGSNVNTGIAAPTTGDVTIRFRVANGNLLVTLLSGLYDETVLINQMVGRTGGAFKPAFGYDGAASGRPTSISLLLDVGRDKLCTPSLTATELWGVAEVTSATRDPFGGNGWNHPASRIQEVYRYVLDNANLCGANFSAHKTLARIGVGTPVPAGTVHAKTGESGVTAAPALGSNIVTEGVNSAGITHRVTDIGTAYAAVVSTPTTNSRATCQFNSNTGLWEFYVNGVSVARFPDLSGSTTWDPPSLAVGASATTGFTVLTAAVGDCAIASFDGLTNSNGWSLNATVTAENTVRVILTNNTVGTVDLPSGTLRVKVFKP